MCTEWEGDADDKTHKDNDAKTPMSITMPNLTVAVLAPNGYARDLGKKGTSTDITFYNLKKGHDTITFLEPTRYPDRHCSM